MVYQTGPDIFFPNGHYWTIYETIQQVRVCAPKVASEKFEREKQMVVIIADKSKLAFWGMHTH